MTDVTGKEWVRDGNMEKEREERQMERIAKTGRKVMEREERKGGIGR